MRHAEALRPSDLLKDADCAEAELGEVGIEEGIDRRQSLTGDIGDRHGAQDVLVVVGTEKSSLGTEKSSRAPVAPDEVLEVGGFGLIHAAVTMPGLQIVPIQGENAWLRFGCLVDEAPRFHFQQCAALRPIRREVLDRNSHR